MEQEQRRVAVPSLEQVEEERNRRERRKEYRKALLHTSGILLVVAAIAVLVATKFLPVLQVSGDSMQPVLKDGEIVILHNTDKFETGDLIGFYYQSKILLKRVIGSAGDFIEIDQNGNVYVNNQKLEEPYAEDKALGECDIEFPYQVPEGKVFVMGDNRSVSIDSRSTVIGCVGEEQIVGKVIFRIWPFQRIKVLN